MVVVAVAVALVVGIAIGALVAWRSLERLPPAPDEPAFAAEPEPAPVPAVLAEAIDHVEVGLVVAGATGEIVFRNPAARAFSGTHRGVIVDEAVDRVVRRALHGERAGETVELHGPPKVALALVAEPISTGGAVVSIQDVSDEMRSAAVRTDFVANISHELKTPVGALAVLAEALADEQDPVVVSRVVDRLVEESHRAARTIDDLLELAEIEGTSPRDDVVDLEDVVQEAIARGRVADRGRGIRVEALELPGPVALRCDRRQIVSALGNLVENAVKYSDDGGSVQVRTRVDERHVEVMVADHGVGISERDLERIFERFYRVDKARRRETGGTGLGLAIVSHAASNHGGDVMVSSSEGEGSTFVFRLPTELVVGRVGDDTVPLGEERTR